MITLLNKFDDKYLVKEEDVMQLISFYLKSNSLANFVSDVVFSDEVDFLASYNISNNVITINNKKAWNLCHTNTDKVFNNFNIDENNYSYFLNFYYISIVFHELIHGVQKMKYEGIEDEDDLYVYLYDLCNLLEFTDVAFYNKNHDLFPMEIEANNVGLLKSYQLMTYTKLPNRECKIMYLQYLSSLLSNYQKINNYRIITPLDRLYKKDNNIDMREIYELLDKAKLSKIERFNLGLDISSKEYDSIIREKQKIIVRNK